MINSIAERLLGWRWAALKNGLLDSVAYRWEFIFGLFGDAAVPLLIQTLIWGALYSENQNALIAGMTFKDMMSYTIASVLFSQIRGGDLDFEVSEMIRTGQLSQYMLRPIGVLEFVFVRGTSTRLLIALICLIAGLGWTVYTGGSVGRLCGAMFLALIGNVIHFQVGAALTATAFYWEEAYSILMVKNVIVGLLSGEMIPLFLVPEKWAWIWKSTPFYLYVYGPAQYTLGHWTHMQFFQACMVGLIWIVGLWGCIRLVWGVSMKRYMSLGG